MDFTHALTLALLPEAMLVGVAADLGDRGHRPARAATRYPSLDRVHRPARIAGGVRADPARAARRAVGHCHQRVERRLRRRQLRAVHRDPRRASRRWSRASSATRAVRRIPSRSSAFYALILVATAAVEAIAAQREMVTFFIALALLLVCLVALGALVKTDPRGGVSSFEHLVEGMVGTGVRALRARAALRRHREHEPVAVVGRRRGDRAPGVDRARRRAASCSGSAARSASSRCDSGSGAWRATSRQARPDSSSR